MPDPKTLKVGDKIRLLCVPEGDRLYRAEQMSLDKKYRTDTADVIEKIIAEDPIVAVAFFDESGTPWYSREMKDEEGRTVWQSLAIYNDETWEIVHESKSIS